MDKKTLIYQSLKDLTSSSEESNRYFSVNRILFHGRGNAREDGIWNKEIPNNQLPWKEDARVYLEILVNEGKAECILADTGSQTRGIRFYRAIDN